MPLPFILGGVALAAAGFGAKKAVDGIQKKSIASEIIEESNADYQKAKASFDKKEKLADEQLTALGNLQLKIGSDFAEFKSISESLIKKLEHSSNKNIQVNVPKHNLNKINDVSISATTYMAEVVGAGAVGAAAAYAVYGGVMALAAASTGTPIAALSGVAAYNATMAAIGGGAIAAGGFGMAGGAAVLGGVVAAPIIAVAGVAFDNFAKKKLESAKEFKTETEKAIKKLEIAEEYLLSVSTYSLKIQRALQEIYKIFTHYFNDLQKMDLLIRNGVNIDELEPAIINVVENGYLVAAILADIIDTPLFKVKKDEFGEPVLKDNTLQIEVDENGNNIINELEIDADIQTALKDIEKFK